MLHPKTKACIFCVSAPDFTNGIHILSHKTRLTELKRIQVIQNIFFDYSGIKPDTDNKKIFGKIKYLETKYTAKCPMGQRRSQKGSYSE